MILRAPTRAAKRRVLERTAPKVKMEESYRGIRGQC
jgi:hypothetical protein